MATAGEIAAPAEYRRFTLYDCFFVNMGGSITLAIGNRQELRRLAFAQITSEPFGLFYVVLVRSGPFPLQTDRTPIVPVARHRFQGVTKCRLPIFGTPLDRPDQARLPVHLEDRKPLILDLYQIGAIITYHLPDASHDFLYPDVAHTSPAANTAVIAPSSSAGDLAKVDGHEAIRTGDDCI